MFSERLKKAPHGKRHHAKRTRGSTAHFQVNHCGVVNRSEKNQNGEKLCALADFFGVSVWIIFSAVRTAANYKPNASGRPAPGGGRNRRGAQFPV